MKGLGSGNVMPTTVMLQIGDTITIKMIENLTSWSLEEVILDPLQERGKPPT